MDGSLVEIGEIPIVTRWRKNVCSTINLIVLHGVAGLLSLTDAVLYMQWAAIDDAVAIRPLGTVSVCTNFLGDASFCRDVISSLTKSTHVVCFKQSDMMWAMRYEGNMHKWVTRAAQDMRDNANLHDYMDRWVIYLRSCLTAILDEGHMSGIRSRIL